MRLMSEKINASKCPLRSASVPGFGPLLQNSKLELGVGTSWQCQWFEGGSFEVLIGPRPSRKGLPRGAVADFAPIYPRTSPMGGFEGRFEPFDPGRAGSTHLECVPSTTRAHAEPGRDLLPGP